MSQPFLAQIALFPYNFAPKGWALCQGQLMSISQNTALFSLLGTYYGGDGKSTFGLPDLQSRVPVGVGQGAGLSQYTLGEQVGVELVTLIANENASHNHSLNATTDSGTVVTASGNQLADAISGSRTSANLGLIYSSTSNPPNTSLAANALSLTGGNAGHNNIQPYQCLSYCIALQGIYPSRN
jgi:microcystin-dependent protein